MLGADNAEATIGCWAFAHYRLTLPEVCPMSEAYYDSGRRGFLKSGALAVASTGLLGTTALAEPVKNDGRPTRTDSPASFRQDRSQTADSGHGRVRHGADLYSRVWRSTVAV